jgi:hypothetical protein
VPALVFWANTDREIAKGEWRKVKCGVTQSFRFRVGDAVSRSRIVIYSDLLPNCMDSYARCL